MGQPSDLIQGPLDLPISKMPALEPMPGWAIGQRLKPVSTDVLEASNTRVPRMKEA